MIRKLTKSAPWTLKHPSWHELTPQIHRAEPGPSESADAGGAEERAAAARPQPQGHADLHHQATEIQRRIRVLECAPIRHGGCLCFIGDSECLVGLIHSRHTNVTVMRDVNLTPRYDY